MAEEKKVDIAYCEHPLPAEEKQKLMRQDKKIVDAKFAPKDAKLAYERPKKKAKQGE